MMHRFQTYLNRKNKYFLGRNVPKLVLVLIIITVIFGVSWSQISATEISTVQFEDTQDRLTLLEGQSIQSVGVFAEYESKITAPSVIPWDEIAKLTASDAATDDGFATSVAIDGTTVVIGASGDDDAAGSVYVFERPIDGWVTASGMIKLTASDAVAGDVFGASVAISGDTTVVGARNVANSAGAAYVFERPNGGWVSGAETAKLTASDAAENDRFGYSVAINGNTIVVGAPNDGGYVGAAYVFERPVSGWITTAETAKLTVSVPGADDSFGQSVGIEDTTIVVGALGDDHAGEFTGAAYVFERPGSSWTTTSETAKLTASDAASLDHLGFSVAINNDTIVAAAPRKDSAYIFERPVAGWISTTETAKLTASDTIGNYFGWSISINNETVVVGAYIDHEMGNHSGAAYVFVQPNGGWVDSTEVTKLNASNAATLDHFGDSVAVSGDTVVVGSPFNDDTGSAYIFTQLSLDFGVYLPVVLSDVSAPN